MEGLRGRWRDWGAGGRWGWRGCERLREAARVLEALHLLRRVSTCVTCGGLLPPSADAPQTAEEPGELLPRNWLSALCVCGIAAGMALHEQPVNLVRLSAAAAHST